MLSTSCQQTTWVASLCLAMLGTGLLRADDVPAERRLPPGVLAFLTVPDATDLKNRFDESGFGQLIQDESLEEFRDQFTERWDELSKKIEEETGLSTTDLLALVDGEVTFAALQPPGRSLGALAMLDFGDHRETLDAILQQAQEAAEKDGDITRTVETVEDTDVTVYTNAGEQVGPNTIAYFVRDEHLVVSLSKGIDLLEDVLVRWDGEHATTFAGDEVFSYMMQKCHPDGAEQSQLRWYFSPIDLFRTIATMPQANQGGLSPAMALGFLPALGLDKFKALGGASSIGTEEFEGVSHTFLYVNQPTSGVIKFFECPAVRQEPPRWVPADVSAYSSANWDVQGAYQAVEAVIDFFQPPGTLANVIDQLSQQGPQVHIKGDVIDSLSGRFQVLGEMRDDVQLDSAQPGVFALELRDSDKMADVLDRFADFSQGKLTSRDFRGVTIYEAEFPNFQTGEQQALGFAVAKGQLFFATDVELLEDYLRIDEAEEPLISSTDYRRISSHFPSETSMISFARPAAQLRPFYEQLRGGELVAMIEDIDFSVLPEFDELVKYFSTSGGYAVPDENGALFVSFSLRND